MKTDWLLKIESTDCYDLMFFNLKASLRISAMFTLGLASELAFNLRVCYFNLFYMISFD